MNKFRIIFISFLMILFFSVFAFADLELSDLNSVYDKTGNRFYLDMSYQEVVDILGEPDKKENLWEKFSDASCAYYLVSYDEGIYFTYYDTNNKINTISVGGKDFHISDEKFEIGSKLDDVMKFYGNSPYSKKVEKDEKTKKRIIRLNYLKSMPPTKNRIDGEAYFAGFDFNEKTKKCVYFYITVS